MRWNPVNLSNSSVVVVTCNLVDINLQYGRDSSDNFKARF